SSRASCCVWSRRADPWSRVGRTVAADPAESRGTALESFPGCSQSARRPRRMGSPRGSRRAALRIGGGGGWPVRGRPAGCRCQLSLYETYVTFIHYVTELSLLQEKSSVCRLKCRANSK